MGLYLTETTRDRISSSRAAPKTARAAGGGGVEAAPYFRKQVMERIRNTVVDRNTSKRELKVALAKVFTGEFFITCLGGGGGGTLTDTAGRTHLEEGNPGRKQWMSTEHLPAVDQVQGEKCFTQPSPYYYPCPTVRKLRHREVQKVVPGHTAADYKPVHSHRRGTH